jgi:tRNA dimethylallyltransferase
VVSPRLTVIQGATASGKSALAIALAKVWGAEIIGADSMQVFESMHVGTAAPSLDERAEVKHHLIGCWQANEAVSAARWSSAVDSLLADRPQQPFIIVGGSNMWIRLWLQGLVDAPAADNDLRRQLDGLSSDELAAKLRHVDPQSADKIHSNDRYRMLRALAHFETTGMSLAEARREHGWGEPRYRVLRLALLPERAWLHARIEARAEMMYAEGLVDEAVSLRQRFGDIQPLKVLGYRDALSLADGRISGAEALRLTQRDTRRYARNQETWIRKDGAHVIGGAGTMKERSGDSLAAEIIEGLAAGGLAF